MLWSVVLFLSSLRASSPFGRVMRIHASARGFAAHSRVPSQLASLSIIGGFARWLFPQDLINPELKIKWKRERMWPHFLFKCLVTRNQRIMPISATVFTQYTLFNCKRTSFVVVVVVAVVSQYMENSPFSFCFLER